MAGGAVSLSFGGRVPEERAAPAPTGEPTEGDWLAVTRIDSGALLYWFEATLLADLDRRMGVLEGRLDDPSLADHPKWGEGWNRLTRMQGDRKEHAARLDGMSKGLSRDWRVLSAAGKAYLRRVWNLGPEETPVERIAAEAEHGRLLPMAEKPPF